MSSKRRKKESKREKEDTEKILFREALKKFLGRRYANGIKRRNKMRTDDDLERYTRNCQKKGKKAEFQTLEEYKNDKSDLEDYGIRKVLLYQRVETLISFYESEFGEKVKMGKTVVVDMLVNHWNGVASDYTRRKSEIMNIDDTYIHDTTQVFTLNDVNVPRDVMIEILSYLRYNHRLIRTVGSVNSSFYLLILTSWKSVVSVTSHTIHKISVLVLKSTNGLYLGKGLGKGDFEYLLNNITPSRIRLILFCIWFVNAKSIASFFDCCDRRKISFPSVTSFYTPPLFSRKENRKIIIRFNNVLPNLQKIDDVVLKCMDLSKCQNLQEIVIGNRMKATWDMRKPWSMWNEKNGLVGDREFLEDEDMAGYVHFLLKGKYFSNWNYGGSSSYSIVTDPNLFEKHLWNKESKIRTLKSRIRLLDPHYRNLCRYIHHPKFAIEKLEIIVHLTISKKSHSFRGFTLDGRNVTPEHYIFSELPKLKEITIKQERLYTDNTRLLTVAHLAKPKITYYTLFLPKMRIKTRCMDLTKVHYYNVPISICQSSVDHFPNLKIFRVVFSDLKYLPHVPKPDFSLFFERFITMELSFKSFKWVDSIFFMEDKTKSGEDGKKVVFEKRRKIFEGRHRRDTTGKNYDERFDLLINLIQTHICDEKKSEE